MDPVPEGLRRFIENTMDMRLAEAVAAYREAIATPPQPEPAPTGWITDRVPEEGDGFVWVPERYGAPDHKDLVPWNVVYPGTPWAPASLIEPGLYEPATLDRNGWITDRVPTAADAGSEDDVRVASRDKTGNAEDWIHWSLVHPGTPWASPRRGCPAPWDPTTLDRNGWVRSRLPTAGDSSNCLVKVPSRPGGEWFVFQDYALIVPGQPWAPISVTPGPYQP